MDKTKKIRILATTSLVLNIVLFGLTIGDYLALHDISNDYVSKGILRYLDVGLSKELPAWTDTSGEWALVRLSLVSRVAFLVLNAITLFFCVQVLRQRSAQAN